MAACTNNGGSRARRAVTAALVGVLSVGAVPMAAIAEGVGDAISPMFIDPTGAFEGGNVTATFSHGQWTRSYDSTTDEVASLRYVRNLPVILDYVEVEMFGAATQDDTLKIDVDSDNDPFEVTYHYRNDDGTAGDEIDGDVVDAGKYVAVVRDVSGDYENGEITIPFDITPIDISNIIVQGETDTAYDSEDKNLTFWLDANKNGIVDSSEQQLYVGTDINVQWYRTGHDTSEENKADAVNEAGTYRAHIEGTGKNYTGSSDLNDQVIEVRQLNLNSDVYIPAIYSDSSSEPEVPGGLFIEGKYFSADSDIVSELKAELNPTSDMWDDDNERHIYKVTAAAADDPNITGDYSLNAYKVSEQVKWTYKGQALSDHQEIFTSVTDGSNFSDWDIVATDSDGNEYTRANGGIDLACVFDNADGSAESSTTRWWTKPGTYTALYRVTPSYASDDVSDTAGGCIFVTVNVYDAAVDADATAAVIYDNKVVSSITTTYDGSDVSDDIKVVVKDENGKDYSGQCTVSYYDKNGNQVREVKDAGTYTLRLTSSSVKLSGTTEMTITVNPVTIGAITSNKLVSTKFDAAGVGNYDYLPWLEDGYGIAETKPGLDNGLGLYYLDENDNEVWVVTNLGSVIRPVITNSDGDKVDMITDEGVYTISFEARNADAENNYVMPDDLTITCVKSEHARFADVRWNDYFIDSVTWVSGKGFMTGYGNSDLFGSRDKITRADVVGTLYKMAGGDRLHLDDVLYDTIVGWKSFDDVDGTQYYGRALAWAKSAGIVNGHDGKFYPNEYITREEFAAMLSNYAQKYGAYETADASALDAVSDGGQVSGWAVDAVAWAVENGIMGNGGYAYPQDEIIRADAAGMIWHFAS